MPQSLFFKQTLLNIFLKFKNVYKKQNHPQFIKLILLCFSFFFITGTYAILRPLKASVFLGMVGKEYQPLTKIISIIILIPCMLLYAKLVNKLKRYQVVYFFLILYIIGLILVAIGLSHPTLGLKNTNTNINRILGWIFYLFTDLYSPLVVSTFWAFANSISTIDFAKKNYGKIVAFSRIGGILTALISWFIMQISQISYDISIPYLLISCSLFLTITYFCISQIIKKIPNKYLHGYEAVYKAEKEKLKRKNTPNGLFSGLKFIITKPYIFGIFWLVYIYDAISVIIDYQMQVLISVKTNNGVQQMSSFMFLYTAAFHILTLFFAFFGTSIVLKKIGVKFSILIMPIATILLMTFLLCNTSLYSVFIIMILFRAIHYGFNAPVREILYIPTTKDIKFKSKAWIDSFGKSLSKTSGSTFNLLSQAQNSFYLIKIDSIFAIAISVIWTIISIFIGKKYSKTIKNNQVIGEEKL
ncbi:hypothetical protein KAT08_02740 [Candidatus Babeliales bacterium]|nr:hypothetical protein [Candidatus Babeliales bacterium]